MPVRIAIDMGNTETAVALFDEERILGVRRLRSERFAEPGRVFDLLAETLGTAAASSGAGDHPVYEGSVVSTVIPGNLAPLLAALSQTHPGEPLVVGPSIELGIRIGYEFPEELGPDRIADAVAGYAEAGGAVIVVDLGTATTFNAVSAEGVFLGGAIAPGIRTGAEALARSASRLRLPELLYPERTIGRTTDEALRAGILRGAAAMIDGMVESVRREMGGGLAIATGGMSGLVAPHARTIDRTDELLTLKGLKLLDERNRSRGRPVRRG